MIRSTDYHGLRLDHQRLSIVALSFVRGPDIPPTMPIPGVYARKSANGRLSAVRDGILPPIPDWHDSVSSLQRPYDGRYWRPEPFRASFIIGVVIGAVRK